MSDVGRDQVFRTTRVRTTLKNDVSWIHSSKQDKKEEAQAKTDQAVETRHAPVRENSYVLSAAKKFENPAIGSNGEIIPHQEDAQPAGPTLETTDNTKPQAPTEGLVQNGKEPGKSVANTAVENPEAVSPVETSEQQAADPTAEKKGENPDTTADLSNAEHCEAEISADDHVETSAAVDTEESKDNPTEVPDVPAVELKPQEEPSNETEPASTTHLDGAELPVQHEEGSCETCPPEQVAGESVEAATEVGVDTSPDKRDVINATLGEEAAPQDSVEPVPQLAESVSELPTQTAAETPADVAEVAVVLVPETPAVTPAAAEEVALQDSVDLVPDSVPVADTVSDLPTQPAAETAVESAECEVKSVASAEPVLQTTPGDIIESEVQPVVNTVVEQSVEPTPESEAHAVELSIKDAVEPGTDAEAVQDTYTYRVIELTDALDVQPSKAEADPEPNPDPSQSHSEEMKVNQQSDGTHTSESFQNPLEELQSRHTLNETRDTEPVCAFCYKIIDGNVKLTLSEPPVRCHPECLKCGECTMALGDLLTPMFLHNQVILCGGCFAKALKT